jgi:hypothetical protein
MERLELPTPRRRPMAATMGPKINPENKTKTATAPAFIRKSPDVTL